MAGAVPAPIPSEPLEKGESLRAQCGELGVQADKCETPVTDPAPKPPHEPDTPFPFACYSKPRRLPA